MICVHRLKGAEFWINHRLIETVQTAPDTIVTLSNEHRYVIREGPDELRKLIWDFESQIQIREISIQ